MKIGVASGPEASMIDDAKDVCSILTDNGVDPELEEKMARSIGRSGKSHKRLSVDVIIELKDALAKI